MPRSCSPAAAEDGDACNFRVLGPVEVIASGRSLRFARRQQLDLAALFMLRCGSLVTMDEIIEAMWGGAPPATVTVQVQNMASALRAALTDGNGPLATVDRKAAGYTLRITNGRLDLAVFTGLAAQAQSARTPAQAAGLLREALSLWHGTAPLAGVRAPYAIAARAQLSERRHRALEQLFDAELRCGNHHLVVPELTAAVAADPVRQHLVAQLMLALYRSGRITDALAAYQNARLALSEGYGLDAGSELRDLERRILQTDRTLDLLGTPNPVTAGRSGPPPYAPGATEVLPAQLPLDVGGFAGRSAELARLATIADATPSATVIAVVTGTAGVGKTALAVHFAHQVSDRYPDGQLYVNLRGFHSADRPAGPREVLCGFLDALGIAPARLPPCLDALAALYRSVIARKRVLVLLDNALDGEQVRPLLPGAPGALVLITSRDQLIDLVALEGAQPLTLDVLPEGDAHDLLVGRLGPHRVAAETHAATQIASRCARLPLALALVAARAAVQPALPLGRLAAELRIVRKGLGTPLVDGIIADVQAAFSWSYRKLTPPAAALFRLLGLHPAQDLGDSAAASLAGTTVFEARSALSELTRAHLIVEHTPGRYSLHDLLRTYAADLGRNTDSVSEQQGALRRVLAHYLHSAYAAAVLIYPHRFKLALLPREQNTIVAEFADAAHASAWFRQEHAALVAAATAASDADLSTYAWQLASALSTYFDRGGHWGDWLTTQHIALAVAERTGDRVGQAHAHGGLGLANNRLRRYPEAHAHLRRADELFGGIDPVGQAYTNLRMSLVHEGQGDLFSALTAARQALHRFQRADHPVGRGQALNSIGWLHAQLGDHREAIAHCMDAVEQHRQLADQEGLANALDSLGFAHHNLGDHAQAVVHYQEALSVLCRLADPYYETITLGHLGDTYHAAGDQSAAADAWRRALATLEELVHPDARDLRDRLARLGAAATRNGSDPLPAEC